MTDLLNKAAMDTCNILSRQVMLDNNQFNNKGIHMLKPSSCLFVLLIFVTLPGCASIVTGSNQGVSVETPGCPGVACKLTNDKGSWFIAETPASVTVHRAYDELTVVCSKEGYVSDTAGSASSSTKGMAFGNILFGGIIGVGVDVGTGAAYDYPTVVSIPMDCSENNASIKKIKSAALINPDLLNRDDSLSTSSPDSNNQPDVHRCAELEQKMDEAKAKPFTLAVLQENYKVECAPGKIEGELFSLAEE